MKSAIFENINDRQNITNAYMKMVNEANEEIEAIAELFKDKKHPITIIDDSEDPPECVIDLEDIEDQYLRFVDDPSAWETKDYDDRYYISLAFDKLGIDEVYRKILEMDSDFCMTPFMIHTMSDSMVNTIEDLKSTIAQIGKDWEEELHKDDIEVAIPEWAVTYLENKDNSSSELTQDDYDMVDAFVREWVNKGYELVYDGTDLGFGEPVFGDDCNRVRYYLVKMDDSENVQNESTEDAKEDTEGYDSDGWFNEKGELVRDIPSVCIRDCTRTGEDAYNSCATWVHKLKFDKGLDIPLVKGYLESTGGWDDIERIDDEEAAIRLLWNICCDIKDGMYPISINSGNYYKDRFISESTYCNHKVIVTAIRWPYDKYEGDPDRLPLRFSGEVETMDDENVEDVVKDVLCDIWGIRPSKVKIAKDTVMGCVTQNEMVSQSEVDKLKKKNPKLRNISEQI